MFTINEVVNIEYNIVWIIIQVLVLYFVEVKFGKSKSAVSSMKGTDSNES